MSDTPPIREVASTTLAHPASTASTALTAASNTPVWAHHVAVGEVEDDHIVIATLNGA